jgi:undecaprenyl-diphosphatase UppP
MGLKAFTLFKDKNMAIFFIFSMLLGVALQITNGFANPFLGDFGNIEAYHNSFGVLHSNVLISLSQVSETLCILLIPFFLRRFGIKKVMLIAMFAWVLRFGFFAVGNPGSGIWLFVLSMIIYGVAFIFVERQNRGLKPRIDDVHAIDYRTALLIGAFQCLSLIPGTSRSGSTILGGILLGVSRPAAAEFSFFLAIPTMLGASALKLLKYLLEGMIPSATEIAVLLTGCVVSFIVSMLVIKALMEYVRKRSFSSFGVYRIELGMLVIGYWLLKSFVL